MAEAIQGRRGIQETTEEREGEEGAAQATLEKGAGVGGRAVEAVQTMAAGEGQTTTDNESDGKGGKATRGKGEEGKEGA